MKLRVLMSAYNGERYIREQLDSILEQSLCKDPAWSVEIMVRDDGSSDSTRDILSEYESKNAITVLYGENKGVIASFFTLIQEASKGADYVALADQDDVWMPDKMETAVSMLEARLAQGNTGNAGMPKRGGGQLAEKKPLLYCGACQAVDENLKPIDTAFLTGQKRPGFGNALVENICTGCTAVFNQALAEILRKEVPEYTVMHDWWIYLCASCFGEVVYDSVPHIYYRQHGDNTVGVNKNYRSEFLERIQRFRGNRYHINRQIQSLQHLYQNHPLKISKENKELVNILLAARKHMGARIKMIGDKRIYRQRKMVHFIFKLIFLSVTM